MPLRAAPRSGAQSALYGGEQAGTSPGVWVLCGSKAAVGMSAFPPGQSPLLAPGGGTENPRRADPASAVAGRGYCL